MELSKKRGFLVVAATRMARYPFTIAAAALVLEIVFGTVCRQQPVSWLLLGVSSVVGIGLMALLYHVEQQDFWSQRRRHCFAMLFAWLLLGTLCIMSSQLMSSDLSAWWTWALIPGLAAFFLPTILFFEVQLVTHLMLKVTTVEDLNELCRIHDAYGLWEDTFSRRAWRELGAIYQFAAGVAIGTLAWNTLSGGQALADAFLDGLTYGNEVAAHLAFAGFLIVRLIMKRRVLKPQFTPR